MAALGNQRHLFDIPENVAWFNCAARTPFLKSVVAAGEKAMAARLNPWTWDGGALEAQSDRVRGLFAELIGADAEAVAIQPAASYGLAVAARNLSLAAGQSIVVIEDQFPSNVFIWMEKAADAGARVITVPRPTDGDWTAAVLDHIDGDTAIAALPPCHWADGTVLDLETGGAACRNHGAALVVDVTQWVGAAPFDVAKVQPDFLVSAAYKWQLCPNGMSFFYAAPHRRDGRPLEHHDYNHPVTGASIEGSLVYDTTYSTGAWRFDVGQTFDPVKLAMAEAALAQVAAWTPEAVAQSLAPVMARILEIAGDLGFDIPAGQGSVHITSIRKPSPPPPGMIGGLAAKGVHASLRCGGLRLAPHAYVSDDDIARLRTALAGAWPD